MAAPRARSGVLAAALALAACVLLTRWAAAAFLPAPQAPGQQQLRGAAAAAAAATVAAAPLAAVAEDALVDYNMAGEFTNFFIVGYFGLTTAFTVFAFLSYLILTKLKII
uniref:Photosystem II reaction center protein T n=1 Tax=Alexandrium monilatum TaxID=311494 RepID=A0A6T1EYX4_9DINO